MILISYPDSWKRPEPYSAINVRGFRRFYHIQQIGLTHSSRVPPNVHFEVDDIENQWIYSSKFDYIHCRYLTGSIKDWPKLMQQAFKFTKPGGWVEFQDFTMTFYTSQGELSESSALSQWAKGIREGVAKIGMEPESGPKLEGWVKEAGFSNVTPHIFPIPVGMWAKDPKMVSYRGAICRIFLSVPEIKS